MSTHDQHQQQHQQQQQQHHYALVNAGSNPLLLQQKKTENDNDTDTDTNTDTNTDTDTDNAKQHDPQSQLTQIYQQYSELYPNPKLVEEFRLKHTLLQAASAAANAQSQSHSQSHSQSAPSKERKGFFARLFGQSPAAAAPNEPFIEAVDHKHSAAISTPLVYTKLPNELDDGRLCGTQASLDISCIPEEAYMVARSHLVSSRRGQHHPNAVRWGPMDGGRPIPTHLMVVGLGLVAEFQPNRPSMVWATSDRPVLLEYATQEPFRLEHARACAFSPHCLAISWGFADGLAGIYRRYTTEGGDEGQEEGSWERLWMVGPSRPVLEAIGDVFHDDAGQPGSPSLRITDVLPLRVETGDPRQPLVATLAISRLGGYLELLAMPTQLWFGPVLTSKTHQRTGPSKMMSKHKSRGQLPQHYALGLQIGSPSLALTTGEYHMDVLAMEALRTRVFPDTVWDQATFPNAPPAEFLLVASGLSTQEGHDCLTFWSVSTLFSEHGDGDFQLHSTLLEAITLPTGAGVSVFASQEILQHWRMPRHVALRPDAPLEEEVVVGGDETNDSTSNSSIPITTISTTAPVVSLHFHSSQEEEEEEVNDVPRNTLALLDWNGGITLLDCTMVAKIASQELSPAEFARYHNIIRDNGRERFPVVETLLTRAQFAKALGREHRSVSNLQWLKGLKGGETVQGERRICPLVLLRRDPSPTLAVTSLSLFDDMDPQASTITLPFPAEGATMGDMGAGTIGFVSQRQNKEGAQILKFFVMRPLEPAAIVESLARESKYEEAIAAAQKLDELDQAMLAQVLEECHRRLWETKHDIDSLADTRNVTYVVDQALRVCGETEEVLPDLTLDKLRVLCQLVIAMGRNHGPSRKSLQKVRVFLIQLGTYELLCKRFSVAPTLQCFRRDFQPTSMVQLAESLAQRGDIFGLSIVWFRHRPELATSVFDILEHIPLSIPPQAFVHLLPVIKAGEMTDTFVSSDAENPALHWSQLPQHLLETENVAIVLDGRDEQAVLDYNASIKTPTCTELTSQACRWFVGRSSQMQLFTGNLRSVVVFCEIGLRCTTGASVETIQRQTATTEMQPLYKTWRSATSLQKILLDDFVALESGGGGEESKDAGAMLVSTDDLLSMDLAELVELVLQGETDSSKILARCSDYLQPLLLEIGAGDSDAADLDSALVSYCKGLAEECIGLARDDDETSVSLMASAQKTLATCAALAASSKTSLHQRERLIKDKLALVEMVLDVMKDVALSLERSDVPGAICRQMVDSAWTMYEALPDQMPSSAVSRDVWLPLLQSAESLYRNLVCVDVLSRWPGCKPFIFFAKQHRNNGEEITSDERSELVLQLCKSFTATVNSRRRQVKKSMLFSDLISDLVHLNGQCYAGSLELPQLLSIHLVRPLLQLEHFHLVVEYLRAIPAVVDKELVKTAVLAYVDEAVFSDDGNTSQVMSAMQCQDVIGPAFPEIQAGFMSIRRYLDAAHFISTVIYEGQISRPVRPAELRKQPPLDVIESILQEVPQSVYCGCPQWQDEEYAIGANRALRSAFTKKNGPDLPGEVPMPALPGGAIFHLATVLELEDDNSALVVKCRVIHHALSAGFHGAAAAICRTMVRGDMESLGEEAIASAKMAAVAEVISDENYTDILTKRELCHATLEKYSGQLRISNCAAFDTICAMSALLEHKTSRYSREPVGLSPERRQALMARPISRLQRHSLAEYNADVHGLFADLISQTSNGVVHDSLMNALSRFLIYWCVSDSKTLRSRLVMAEKSDALDNLALGCGLILQIPSKLTAGNCVHELQKIAADQAANLSTEERFGSDNDICIPDPQLVHRMVGRGYSATAAHRAVVMTCNVGYTEALGWAVAHTMDSNFNEPIIIVKDPRRVYIDEDAIQRLHKGLYVTQHLLDNPEAMEHLLLFLTKLHKKESGVTATSVRADQGSTDVLKNHAPVASPRVQKANPRNPQPMTTMRSVSRGTPHSKVPAQASPTKATSSMPHSSTPEQSPSWKALLTKASSTSAPQKSMTRMPPPKPTPRVPQSPAPAKSVSTRTVVSDGSAVSSSLQKRSYEKGTNGSSLAPQPPQQQQQQQQLSKPVVSGLTTKSRVLVGAASGIRATANRTQTSSDRTELLKRGQAALTKLRSNGGCSDRRKLIEEGRALLRKAKTRPIAPNENSSAAPEPPPSARAPVPETNPAPIPSSKVERSPQQGNGAGLASNDPAKDNDDGSDDSGWDFDNFDEM